MALQGIYIYIYMYGFKGVYRGFRQLVVISGRSLALGDVGASRTRTEFWASCRGFLGIL